MTSQKGMRKKENETYSEKKTPEEDEDNPDIHNNVLIDVGDCPTFIPH